MWCAPHAEVLDRVRAELEEEIRVPKPIYRSCAFYGCPDGRKPGSKFCLHHAEQASE